MHTMHMMLLSFRGNWPNHLRAVPDASEQAMKFIVFGFISFSPWA
jgi:hypothetical protein